MVGIQKPAVGNPLRMNISPVPATGNLHIDFEIPVKSPALLTVYDASGTMIKNYKFTPGYEQTASMDINVSGFENGFYFVRLQTNELTLTKKLVICR